METETTTAVVMSSIRLSPATGSPATRAYCSSVAMADIQGRRTSMSSATAAPPTAMVTTSSQPAVSREPNRYCWRFATPLSEAMPVR